MIRMLFGVVIGAGLTLAFLAGNGPPQNTNAQSDEVSGNVTVQDLTSAIREAMVFPLEKSAVETGDSESGLFLDKLIQAYGLNNLPQPGQDGITLVDVLPDFKSLNEQAINMPLAEAGNHIKDKDIAAFYYDFLQRSGFHLPAEGVNLP